MDAGLVASAPVSKSLPQYSHTLTRTFPLRFMRTKVHSATRLVKREASAAKAAKQEVKLLLQFAL